MSNTGEGEPIRLLLTAPASTPARRVRLSDASPLNRLMIRSHSRGEVHGAPDVVRGWLSARSRREAAVAHQMHLFDAVFVCGGVELADQFAEMFSDSSVFSGPGGPKPPISA